MTYAQFVEVINSSPVLFLIFVATFTVAFFALRGDHA